MTDRPIIFSAPMIRALLEGSKTQTRRLKTSPLVKCAAGDRLWVRESVRATEDYDDFTRRVEFRADETKSSSVADIDDNSSDAFGQWWMLHAYRCTDPDLQGGQWVPSIHMPRWASRLTLHVEDVCIERLQGLTEEDALAEGAERLLMDDDGKFYQETGGSHRKGFAGLWSHLHGADSWDANPWIVALTFRVERANIDAGADNEHA